MSSSGYWAAVADSDMFGLLAIYCFIVAAAGLLNKLQSTLAYRAMAFFGLLIVPTLHTIGTYFLNQVPA